MPRGIGTLSSFALSCVFAFGCVAPEAPFAAARTEALVDGGPGLVIEIVSVEPAVMAATQYGLCNTVADCATTISIAGVDAFSMCLNVECRHWDGPAASGVHGGRYQGRCYVSRTSSLPIICAGTALTTALSTATIGVADVITGVLGLGDACSSSSCAPGLWCVDGVCCESECGGGDARDCFACSREKGGPADGLCRPVVAGNVCGPTILASDACFDNGICGPKAFGGTTFDTLLFDGVCRGTLNEFVKCCDPDSSACEPPATCVDFECRVVDAGVPDAATIDASIVWPDGGIDARDAAFPDAPMTRDADVFDGPTTRDANVLDASRFGDANVRDAALDDMTVPVDAAMSDAAVANDANVPRNTPVFRGGGGIRCAVSSPGAPGGENETAAEAFSLLAAVAVMIRSRKNKA